MGARGKEGGKKGSAQSRNPIAAPTRCDAGEVDSADTYSGINQPGDANKCGEACAHAHRRGCKWVTPQWVSGDVYDTIIGIKRTSRFLFFFNTFVMKA